MDSERTWQSTQITGLYRHTPSGIYYVRYSLRGKRTFKSLRTRTFTIAKIRATTKAAELAKARASGVDPSQTVRTMGDLARVYRERLDASQRAESTKVGLRNDLERLEVAWPGSFASTIPGNVDTEKIAEVRDNLRGRPVKLERWKRTRKGYAPSVINRTLGVLATLLAIAREHHLIFASPFEDRGTMGERLFVRAPRRKPSLPSRWDMDRLFTELERIENAPRLDAGYVRFLESQAKDVSEHARFMAYSGMRVEEANASEWEHISGSSMLVMGTKSESSLRTIPVFPELRGLLEEIRKRRVADGVPLRGRILKIESSLDALGRACKRLKFKKVTQHDLRHYFATVAIESGVDIPTVAAWLGHADGGALLMKIYNHLRPEHSRLAASKVTSRPISEESA